MSYAFLVPLLAGIALVGASAFTARLSRRFGERGGQMATSVLRNLLGIPLYFLGLVLAWRSPAPLLTDPVTAWQVFAWALIVAGSVPVIVGHVQLGWRTHMPSIRDTLVTTGLYAHVRHPIYAGALPIFVGLALLRPTAPFALACALSCVFFVIQARLEEIDLLERLPQYREYMQRMPGFLPQLGGGALEPLLSRWLWLCPALGILVAAGVLYWWGLTWWTALLAALLLVCPAIIVWGVVKLWRSR